MLDVRRMRVLREVALKGSFSAAAESLSFTQSAVSQQIAALEREAGAVLVERSARGGRRTAAGAPFSSTHAPVAPQPAAPGREAGAVLVERSARGVRLTDAGEAVVRHAE